MQNRNYAIYIGATADRIWQTLTDPDLNRRYFFGLSIESNWRPGSAIRVRGAGAVMMTGYVIESEPGRRVVFALVTNGSADGPNTWMTWEITEHGGETCRVALSHDDLEPNPDPGQDEIILWLLSNLKTVAEGAPALAPTLPL
jgi:uncharacterized protein YndB with AHSA1/START domain